MPGSDDPTIPPSQMPTGEATRGAAASGSSAQSRSDRSRAPAIPESFGQYRIVRLIGEGGMGAVYEAEQARPKRTVALKVIRPGYATERMLKRFELEAEVLGRLLHPGIAQIYEAGVWTGEEGFTTETQRHREEGDRAEERVGEEQTADLGAGAELGEGGGRRSDDHPTSVGGSTRGSTRIPFFAMELVKGVPLTRYAAEKKLGTRERLELIAKVCDAVQHAHQKGVIHRDLKPSNILVTEIDAPVDSAHHTAHIRVRAAVPSTHHAVPSPHSRRSWISEWRERRTRTSSRPRCRPTWARSSGRSRT